MSEQDATLDEFTDDTDSDQQSRNQATSRFWGVTPEGWELADPDTVYEVNPNPKPDEEPNTYIEMDALDTELPWPRYFGERKASDYSGKTFTAGDTLFARITPCTENGKAALVPEMETKVGIGSTEFAVLSPDRERIIPWYLFYVAKSYPVYNYAVSRMRGSTGRQRVPFSVFRRELDVALPPLEEQRKIASVLHTVDQAIQKTQEVIEQTRRGKSGLLQNLYATGYYDHQNWQEIDVQDAYMMTRTDEVPAEWDIREPDEISEVKTGHTPSTSVEEYWDGEIPWIDIHDLTQLEGTVITSTDDAITREGLENSGAKLLPEGTLVLCRTGAIGDTAITGREMATDQDQVTFECDENTVLTRYLMYLFEYATPQLERLSAGSTHNKIQLHFFSDLGIPLPDTEEQEKIVDVLDSVDSAVFSNKRRLTNLRNLKKGLMQDLLSGEVRTHDKGIEIIDDVL